MLRGLGLFWAGGALGVLLGWFLHLTFVELLKAVASWWPREPRRYTPEELRVLAYLQMRALRIEGARSVPSPADLEAMREVMLQRLPAEEVEAWLETMKRPDAAPWKSPVHGLQFNDERGGQACLWTWKRLHTKSLAVWREQ